MVVDELARSEQSEWKDNKNSKLCRIRIEGVDVALLKPQTFMNLSGKAVAPVVTKFYSNPADLVVVHDDMDIALGRVRIKVGGGAGGHKGIRSIMDSLRFSDFIRVRVGVGRPPVHVPPESFVLSGFDVEDKATASNLIEAGCTAVRYILRYGVEKAQNLLHSEKDETANGASVQ